MSKLERLKYCLYCTHFTVLNKKTYCSYHDKEINPISTNICEFYQNEDEE